MNATCMLALKTMVPMAPEVLVSWQETVVPVGAGRQRGVVELGMSSEVYVMVWLRLLRVKLTCVTHLSKTWTDFSIEQ